MDGVMNNALTKDKFSLIKKLIEKNGFKFTKRLIASFIATHILAPLIILPSH